MAMLTRAQLTLISLTAAVLAGAGCASKPVQESAPAQAIARDCEQRDNNSFHLTASGTVAPQPSDHDTALDFILFEQTSDWRLAQINRQMYQSLRALDAELRREQQIAACERSPFDDALQVQANKQHSTDQQAGGGSASGSDGGATGDSVYSGAVASSAVSGLTAGANRTSSLRRTSISPGAPGGAGNGAVGAKVVPGSDNEIVLRRLRKAAEQETNPSLRAKLWKEYTDYKQGAATK
jgi:hypothetical protein